MEPDVGVSVAADGSENLDGAIDEWFARNDADIRVVGRLPQQMLATAITDLEPVLPETVPEQLVESTARRSTQVECNFRQDFLEQLILTVGQLARLATSE